MSLVFWPASGHLAHVILFFWRFFGRIVFPFCHFCFCPDVLWSPSLHLNGLNFFQTCLPSAKLWPTCLMCCRLATTLCKGTRKNTWAPVWFKHIPAATEVKVPRLDSCFLLVHFKVKLCWWRLFGACWILKGSWNDQRKYPFQEFLSSGQKAAWPLSARLVPTANCIVCLCDVEVQAGSHQPVFSVLNSVMTFLIN